LNNLALSEFPLSLVDFEKILIELPKTEREFYKISLKALKKTIKKDDKIYLFSPADSKLTKTGFIALTDDKIILISLKGGIFGSADTEIIKYTDVKNVDFDILPTGFTLQNGGVLHLEIKSLLGAKKRKIRNIPEQNLDSLVNKIREKI